MSAQCGAVHSPCFHDNPSKVDAQWLLEVCVSLTVCVAKCKLAAFKDDHSLVKALTCLMEYIQVWFAWHRDAQRNVLTMLWKTWISTKESGNYSYEIAKWCSRKTQNLKMKELVSTAAVSFRHARAQVFSFWPFLSIFTWIRLMMN